MSFWGKLGRSSLQQSVDAEGLSHGRDNGWLRLLPAFIVGLIAFVGLTASADILLDHIDDGRTTAYRADMAAAASFQLALANVEAGLRGYVLSGRPQFLDAYWTGVQTLDWLSGSLLPMLDNSTTAQSNESGTAKPASAQLTTLRTGWDSAIDLVVANQREQAAAALVAPDITATTTWLRTDIANFARQQSAAAGQWDSKASAARAVIHVIELGGASLSAIAMLFAFRRITRAITTGYEVQAQTDRLFSMTEMLQSAADQDDINEVLRAAAAALLPDFNGTLYVFNNSRDRLDRMTEWGSVPNGSAAHLVPTSCWGLKRGKLHINGGGDGMMRCNHATANRVTLEIPMAARGELYGLLEIGTAADDGRARLAAIQPIANAIADGMSLALSSLALRERLRSQALRDPLTGLYNRRFLEEMLDRLCLDAERRKASLAAIMIDLDHFKALNDQHGHAAGDAVLRDVAAVILSCLRGTDVVCRYGGEELAILLPDSTMAMALVKAEEIRCRIAGSANAGGLSVTASLGVAAIPETAVGPLELLPKADAALYYAKQHGRNCVAEAPGSGGRSAAHQLSLIRTGSPEQ